MGVQYAEAPDGTEFEPIVEHLKKRFEREPFLKHIVPKRWLTDEQVKIKKKDGK